MTGKWRLFNVHIRGRGEWEEERLLGILRYTEKGSRYSRRQSVFFLFLFPFLAPANVAANVVLSIRENTV